MRHNHGDDTPPTMPESAGVRQASELARDLAFRIEMWDARAPRADGDPSLGDLRRQARVAASRCETLARAHRGRIRRRLIDAAARARRVA